MYEPSAQTIQGGLSLGARIVLGSVAGLFGLVMLATAPGSPSPLGIALFGSFCLAIALACATRGRLRRFLGSLIASAVFAMAIWYVWAQFAQGPLVSGRRSEPSLLNALLFTLFFGLPSAAYVVSARFGFGPQPTPPADAEEDAPGDGSGDLPQGSPRPAPPPPLDK